MKAWTIMVILGVLALAAGGFFYVSHAHRTIGLGGIGLGAILVILGMGGHLFPRGKTTTEGKRTVASPSQKGSYRKGLIAILVVVVIGAGTFYGTSYIANNQVGNPSTGTISSQPSGQGTGASSHTSSRNTGTSGQTTVQTITATSTSLVSCATKPAIAVDGSAINYNGSRGSAYVTLSTSDSPDVVIVFVTAASSPQGSGQNPPSVKNVTDSASQLVFHQRASMVSSITNTGGDKIAEQEWYAIANTSLDGDNIIVNLETMDSPLTVIAFGVSGANTSAPFDTNSGLPAVTTGSNFGQIQVPVSTINNYELVVGGAAMTSGVPGAGYGYAVIRSDNGSAGIDDPITEYQAVCGLETNYGVSFVGEGGLGGGVFFSSPEPWIIIADALVQATAPS